MSPLWLLGAAVVRFCIFVLTLFLLLWAFTTERLIKGEVHPIKKEYQWVIVKKAIKLLILETNFIGLT